MYDVYVYNSEKSQLNTLRYRKHILDDSYDNIFSKHFKLFNCSIAIPVILTSLFIISMCTEKFNRHSNRKKNEFNYRKIKEIRYMYISYRGR